MAADREQVEFALTTLVAWLQEQGGSEIGGVVSRGGLTYQFELRRLEDEDGESVLPSQEPEPK